MGTIVTIEIPATDADTDQISQLQQSIDLAFEWFFEVEKRCTRFNPNSEVMQLTAHTGRAVPVSDIVYEAVQFAVAVAEETDGLFDPTMGQAMEKRGFNREYSTGQLIRTPLQRDTPATYRDIELDPEERTISLRRPLVIDLGAVAKGLAIDLAARELQNLENFSIDAGGDLYVAGSNSQGKPWSIGIRHPRRDNELFDLISVSNAAVCTSGDYERTNGNEHHILDPRSNTSPTSVASATVIAPTAMLADAAATAIFVLGPEKGIQLLDRLGVDGLIISPTLERYETRGLKDYRVGNPAIL